MIWDSPPHRCALYSVASGTDAGGGTSLTYSAAPVQSGVKCLINTSSSSTTEMYAQDNITVSHTVGIKSSLLTTAVTPGMKVVADGVNYHVEGIRAGRAFMGIPAMTYLDCRQLLKAAA